MRRFGQEIGGQDGDGVPDVKLVRELRGAARVFDGDEEVGQRRHGEAQHKRVLRQRCGQRRDAGPVVGEEGPHGTQDLSRAIQQFNNSKC